MAENLKSTDAKSKQRLFHVPNIAEFLLCVERISGRGSADGIPLSFVMKLVRADMVAGNTSNDGTSEKTDERPRLLSYKGNVIVNGPGNSINFMIPIGEGMVTGYITLIGGFSSYIYVQHQSCKAVVILDSLHVTVVRKIEDMVNSRHGISLDEATTVSPYRLVSLKLFVEHKLIQKLPVIQNLLKDMISDVETMESEQQQREKKTREEEEEERRELKDLLKALVMEQQKLEKEKEALKQERKDVVKERVQARMERKILQTEQEYLRKARKQLEFEKTELLKKKKHLKDDDNMCSYVLYSMFMFSIGFELVF